MNEILLLALMSLLTNGPVDPRTPGDLPPVSPAPGRATAQSVGDAGQCGMTCREEREARAARRDRARR